MKMYESYKDRVAFLMVYIHEAHASDEWQMAVNEKEDVVFAQPTSLTGRQDVARQCCASLEITMPCVVDEMDNRVDEAYAAWPERLFIVNPDGKIAYSGGQGPFEFKPEDVERWLRWNVGKPS